MQFKLGQNIIDLIRCKRKFSDFINKNEVYAFKVYFYNYFVAYIPSFAIRRKYLSKIGVQIENRAFTHLGTHFYPTGGGKQNSIYIGEGSVIGRDAVLMGNITIGRNCSITAESYIQTSSHKNNSPTFEGCDCELVIGDYVWMGIRTIIVPGVTKIGNGVIIGANSTVTKNINDYKIVAGSPAKEIGIRDKEACVYELNYQPRWN